MTCSVTWFEQSHHFCEEEIIKIILKLRTNTNKERLKGIMIASPSIGIGRDIATNGMELILKWSLIIISKDASLLAIFIGITRYHVFLYYHCSPNSYRIEKKTCVVDHTLLWDSIQYKHHVHTSYITSFGHIFTCNYLNKFSLRFCLFYVFVALLAHFTIFHHLCDWKTSSMGLLIRIFFVVKYVNLIQLSGKDI